MINKENLKSTIREEMDNVIGLSEETLSNARTELKAAYLGLPYLVDEERAKEGWSVFQDRSVLEVVEWAKPGLLRVFASTDELVRYEPNRPDQEQNAEDATNYINQIVFGGTSFKMIYDIIHDSLTQRVAWGKVYMEKPKPLSKEYSGLLEEEADALIAMSGVDPPLCRKIQEDKGFFTVIIPENINDAEEVKVVALAPENVVWAKDTVDMDSCRFVAHWEDKTIAELVAAGYDRSIVVSALSTEDEDSYPETDIQMEINAGTGADDMPDFTGDMRRLRVYEGYILLPDEKGNGLKRYKVVFIGEECSVILSCEEWRLPRPPLFPVSSFPLSHTISGLCLADQMMDLQRLRTELFRQALDNLALSNQGEFIVQRESQADDVDLDQFLSRRIGGVYCVTGAGVKIFNLPTDPNTSKEAIGALQLTDALKEVRTGIGQQIRGLSADALQNTATGAIIQEDTANQRLEMIARILAECFFKPIAQYVLVLVSRHQNKPIQARIKGQFFKWDPQSWDPTMDVSVSVGLGTGNRAKMVQSLQLILGLQEKLITAFGQNSPVGLVEVMRAMHKVSLGLGFSNPEQFFGTIENAAQKQQILLSQPPKQDPKTQKVQADAQAQMAKTQTSQALGQAQMQIQQNKAMQDMQLKQQEMQNKIAVEREKMMVNAQLQREKMRGEQALDQTRMMVENRAVPGSTRLRTYTV